MFKIILKIFISIIVVVVALGASDFANEDKRIKKHFVVFCLSLVAFLVYLWSSSKIFLIIAIVVFVIDLILIFASKLENTHRTALTMSAIKTIPLAALKESYFFLSDDLYLEKVSNQRPVNKSGKIEEVLVDEKVFISRYTKGKLLEVNGDEIKIQFDTTEDSSLLFKYNSNCLDNLYEKFCLCADKNDCVLYNNSLYEISWFWEYIEFKLNTKHTSHSKAASGAW